MQLKLKLFNLNCLLTSFFFILSLFNIPFGPFKGLRRHFIGPQLPSPSDKYWEKDFSVWAGIWTSDLSSTGVLPVNHWDTDSNSESNLPLIAYFNPRGSECNTSIHNCKESNPTSGYLELWMRALHSESLGLKYERKIWFWVGICVTVVQW